MGPRLAFGLPAGYNAGHIGEEQGMIKLMRESAHKYPWILKSMMGILAVAFVITMGWWGFTEQ